MIYLAKVSCFHFPTLLTTDVQSYREQTLSDFGENGPDVLNLATMMAILCTFIDLFTSVKSFDLGIN